MSYRCAHSPAANRSRVPVVATLIAPLAGELYVGTSGGSGTNGLVSWCPVELFHLRSNWAFSHSYTHGSGGNMLCSRCVSVDAAVQCEDPKIDIPRPRNKIAFS